MSMQNESRTPIVTGLLTGATKARRGLIYAIGCLVFVAFLCMGVTWGGSAVLAWFTPATTQQVAMPTQASMIEPEPVYVGQEWSDKAAECEAQGLRIWVKYHKRTGAVISAYCAK